MDIFHSFPATSTVAILAVSSILFLFSLLWFSNTASSNTNKKRTAPEASGAWPIIGHLRLLGGPRPPYITLANMADKFGTFFAIKLGVHRALVVSNSEIAKQCLTTNDKAFATRPKLTAMEILGYNNSIIAFAPYGPYWRQVRKFVNIELLSNHRLDMLKHVLDSEVKSSLQQLYQLCGKKRTNSDEVLVDMQRWFKDVSLNLILRIIVGKRIPNSSEGGETVKWKKSLDDFIQPSGNIVVSDALPFLRWLDIGGEKKLMKKIAKELDQVVEGWLQEHKHKSAANEANKSEEDFMGVMLSFPCDTEGKDPDTINKATCLTLILAAEETITIAMTWALSLLLNNRDTLKKVQQELDTQVGKDRLLVTESDTKNLVYLQSVIKETFRLYPPLPLSVIHEAIEDCTVNGYHVSAGPWLILNLHKIHRDPTVCGRRMCSGVPFGLHILQLALANVLHWFDFATPFDEPVDMRVGAVLASPKATPLEVHITPRLPVSLYESTS
ncbi:Cytochrome P450, putative [Theobroma cacao]|uniref:Cytochrome P450, putative n=1 Tax=Theobroma cacao TaxID=3641 RepID=A0A061FD60_THECC|nr:Cytochrome P450, putative [Theobroma cacao]